MIPDGWKIATCKNIASLTAGGTPSTRNADYWGGDIMWMTSGDLNARRINWVPGRISELGLLNSSAKIIPRHSVLVGLAGQGKTRGTVAINEIELATNQSVAAIMPILEKVCYLYLFYNLESRYSQLRRLSVGEGGRGGLNLGILGNLRILLPPLPEQRAIVEVLSTWDRAIELTSRLIDAKKNLKKGLMQQLLTGKTRFPEFIRSLQKRVTEFGAVPLDWEYPRVGDVAHEITTRNAGRTDIPVLSCTKYNGLVSSLDYFGRQVFSDNTATYKVVNKADFAYATNHIEEGSIGLLTSVDAGLISPLYTVFRTGTSVHPPFLYAVFKTEVYRHIFASRTVGTINRRGSLRWPSFSRIRVPLPPLDEQRRIADVLDMITSEINLLERNLEALKRQKKGLMQKLLTGQVRVKVEPRHHQPTEEEQSR